MKRTFVVLVAACALLLTLGAGQAFAGGLLSGVTQTVSNSTSQENEAAAANVPILSGNNVALVNGGDQNASAGTTQSQENDNATGQNVGQSDGHGCGCGSGDQSVSNDTNQENEALAVNVPIASGNNVALVNGGDQSASAGTGQWQRNENVTKQNADQSGGGGESVSNRTGQENEALAVNVPIASGNNVALVNTGDQNASAGTSQSQENENATWQRVEQSSSGRHGGSGESVRNRTSQENEAVAVNVPIASGNNIALVNGGSQTASAGTTQSQENENATKQGVQQTSGGGSRSSVRNRTKQENEAAALNVPIASGNNVVLVNCGHQDATAGTSQSQENENATRQDVRQHSGKGSDSSVSNRTSQENEALAVNVPIASGNNVALVNGGSQTASAGTSQSQQNENATWQSAEQSGDQHNCKRW